MDVEIDLVIAQALLLEGLLQFRCIQGHLHSDSMVSEVHQKICGSSQSPNT